MCNKAALLLTKIDKDKSSTNSYFQGQAKQMLGVMYLFGLGVDKNYQNSLMYLEESLSLLLNRKKHISMYLIGYIHEVGLGVPVNLELADEYYFKCDPDGSKVTKWLAVTFGNPDRMSWPIFERPTDKILKQLELAANFLEENDEKHGIFSGTWAVKAFARASDDQLKKLESSYPWAVLKFRLGMLQLKKTNINYVEVATNTVKTSKVDQRLKALLIDEINKKN